MKEIVLTLICAIALATGGRIRNENGCSVENSMLSLVEHENCNQYYQCVFGEYQTLTCPDSLLFNPQFHVCDWAQNVKCGDRLIPGQVGNDNEGSENSDDGSNVVHPLCAELDALNPIMEHDTCNKFYMCSKGSPIVITCPSDLLYNPDLKICDWPQNVNCKNMHLPHDNDLTVSLNSAKTVSNEASVICAAEDSNGVLVEHEHCDQFYKCSDGIPVALDCPLNLMYNPKYQYCDWPENVDCADRTISDKTDDENNTENDDVNDDENSNQGAGHSNPEEAEALCAAEGSNGLLVAHEKCDQFYLCSYGLPVGMYCPLNLLYNPSNEQCDWPWNVECGVREVSNSKVQVQMRIFNEELNEAAIAVCAADGSEGSFAEHERCDKFYMCTGGLPVEQSCPAGLLYNEVLHVCDWRLSVICGNRII